jgi:hypothetical protein
VLINSTFPYAGEYLVISVNKAFDADLRSHSANVPDYEIDVKESLSLLLRESKTVAEVMAEKGVTGFR